MKRQPAAATGAARRGRTPPVVLRRPTGQRRVDPRPTAGRATSEYTPFAPPCPASRQSKRSSSLHQSNKAPCRTTAGGPCAVPRPPFRAYGTVDAAPIKRTLPKRSPVKDSTPKRSPVKGSTPNRPPAQSSTPKRPPAKRTPPVRSPATRSAELSCAEVPTGDASLLDYYHGWLPREDVGQLLQVDGDFLLRMSDVKDGGPARTVISVMWRRTVRHFVIEQQGEQFYVKDIGRFDSIAELVNSFIQLRQPLQPDNKASPVLQRPVERSAWQLLHAQVTLERKLGEGAFGDVFKGQLLLADGGRVDVAVKKHRNASMSRDERLSFLREARTMREYDHPHVVRLLGVAVQKTPIMIVLEYAPKGSLQQYLRDRQKPVLAELVRFCSEAAQGMRYLEERGCIHRDVAARNCLLGDTLNVKISDFGLSMQTEMYKGDVGDRVPVRWLAPEVLRQRTYSLKSDVWAFGVLMWEIFHKGGNPYPSLSNLQVKRGLLSDGLRLSRPAGMPPSIADLMNLCWAELPERRPDFRTLSGSLRRHYDALRRA